MEARKAKFEEPELLAHIDLNDLKEETVEELKDLKDESKEKIDETKEVIDKVWEFVGNSVDTHV